MEERGRERCNLPLESNSDRNDLANKKRYIRPPFDFLGYWRTLEDSGPIKNGRKTMPRHNSSQRDKSLQLAVGHEDDITCFTILRRILYAPLRAQRVRRACVYLSAVRDIKICRCHSAEISLSWPSLAPPRLFRAGPREATR